MRRTWVSLAAMVAALPAMAAADDATVRDENRTWLVERLGAAWDPAAPVRVVTTDGDAESTLGVAVEAWLDLAGERLRWGDVAAAATHGRFPLGGDVWLFELSIGGAARCPGVRVLVDRTGHAAPPVEADPQLWAYDGDVFHVARDDISMAIRGSPFFVFDDVFALGWTTKDVQEEFDAVLTFGGRGSLLCVTGFGFVMLFAQFNGFLTDCNDGDVRIPPPPPDADAPPLRCDRNGDGLPGP